jgi:hypothetical protein
VAALRSKRWCWELKAAARPCRIEDTVLVSMEACGMCGLDWGLWEGNLDMSHALSHKCIMHAAAQRMSSTNEQNFSTQSTLWLVVAESAAIRVRPMCSPAHSLRLAGHAIYWAGLRGCLSAEWGAHSALSQLKRNVSAAGTAAMGAAARAPGCPVHACSGSCSCRCCRPASERARVACSQCSEPWHTKLPQILVNAGCEAAN